MKHAFKHTHFVETGFVPTTCGLLPLGIGA